MKKKLLALGAGTALVAGALTGCAVSTQASSDLTSPVVAETSAVTVDTAAVMKEFVTAVHGDDTATARESVARGSAAERFLLHHEAVGTASRANGDTAENATAAVTFEDGTATATYPDDGTSYTWSDFRFDEDGKITSWTTPSGELSDLVWSADSSGTVAGNTIDLVSAYKSSSGSVYVVLLATSGDEGIDFTIPYDAQFVARDGIAYSPAWYSAADGVPAGASGYVVLQFPDAPFGGTVYLEGYNNDSADVWEVEVSVA